MALTFYCGSGSPFAWKVWLVLEHKKIPYDLRMLSFDKDETRSAEFLAINPRGKVPTIVDGDVVVRESAAIAEYLEDRYPQEPLMPKDPAGRAGVRRAAIEADGYLAPAVNGLFAVTIFAKAAHTDAEIGAAQKAAQAELAQLDRALTGEYLSGSLSLADFTAFPYVRQLQRLDDRMPGKGISRKQFPAQVGAWASRIEALPYYERTIPPHWKS